MVLYFLGQALTTTQTKALEKLDPNAPWHERLIVKHRRLVGVAIPFVFYQVLWWSCAINYNFWQHFPDRYWISITMIFGSMIAGRNILGFGWSKAGGSGAQGGRGSGAQGGPGAGDKDKLTLFTG